MSFEETTLRAYLGQKSMPFPLIKLLGNDVALWPGTARDFLRD